MTDDRDETAAPMPTTVTCDRCGAEVPVARFCGLCGTRLPSCSPVGAGWLRSGAHAAAPNEHVLTPSLVSSLFPHLPHRSRAAFRGGLALLVAALAVTALLGWQAPMVAVAALGFPLLFVLYLKESDVYGDLSTAELTVTTVIGVVLGVGWAWVSGPIVADSYAHDIAIGLGLAPAAPRLLRDGVVIPLVGSVLMCNQNLTCLT